MVGIKDVRAEVRRVLESCVDAEFAACGAFSRNPRGMVYFRVAEPNRQELQIWASAPRHSGVSVAYLEPKASWILPDVTAVYLRAIELAGKTAEIKWMCSVNVGNIARQPSFTLWRPASLDEIEAAQTEISTFCRRRVIPLMDASFDAEGLLSLVKDGFLRDLGYSYGMMAAACAAVARDAGALESILADGVQRRTGVRRQYRLAVDHLWSVCRRQDT